MEAVSGVVTIVQESRFQLVDGQGVAHLFDLHHSAPAEPDQLPTLLRKRVRVSYTRSPGLICHSARQIRVLEA